jgi:hypothetical protein
LKNWDLLHQLQQNLTKMSKFWTWNAVENCIELGFPLPSVKSSAGSGSWFLCTSYDGRGWWNRFWVLIERLNWFQGRIGFTMVRLKEVERLSDWRWVLRLNWFWWRIGVGLWGFCFILCEQFSFVRERRWWKKIIN